MIRDSDKATFLDETGAGDRGFGVQQGFILNALPRLHLGL
jgi:hypothetical protein